MDHPEATDYFASFGWTLTREDADGCRYELRDTNSTQRCNRMDLDELLAWWSVVVGFAYIFDRSTDVALELASQSPETREMIRRWAMSRGAVALPSDLQFEINLPERDLGTDSFNWRSEGARLSHLIRPSPLDLEGEVSARLREDDHRVLQSATRAAEGSNPPIRRI